MSIRPRRPEKNFTEMSRVQIRAAIEALGERRYRADQIHDWVFKRGARSFDQMTNLSKALRQRLVEQGYSVGRVKLGRVAESVDSTRKIQVTLDDGGVVETVLIPMAPGRFTQCISSQLGCALKCDFCFTGTLGLERHLTPGEIVDQVLAARMVVPEGSKVDHVVYMGMGEPLHNLDAVLESIEVLTDPEGIAMSPRRITVSTSGLVPQIERLGQAAPVNLAISLNATTDEVRDVVMPINKKYNIATLMAALRRYPLPPRRKLTIEYVLLGEVNDSADDALRLARLLHGLPVRINLLPWNPFEGPGYQRPADKQVRIFQNILLDRQYTVMVRTTKGLDINAACGQLGERPGLA